jgi:PadR family transcriptional regulator PadR
LSDHNRKAEGNLNSAEGEATTPDIQARPKNWLVPVTLVILRDSTSYGYQLMERLVELGFEAMNPGTIYRTLRKMEKDGLCESSWHTASGGPARRMYSITDYGEAYLEMWVRSLERYQHSIEAFFEAYRRK